MGKTVWWELGFRLVTTGYFTVIGYYRGEIRISPHGELHVYDLFIVTGNHWGIPGNPMQFKGYGMVILRGFAITNILQSIQTVLWQIIMTSFK